MKYTVIWQPLAERALAHLWVRAQDRNGITIAANTIDALLRRNPLTRGESRTGDLRVLVIPPLAVRFHVRELDRLVVVVGVWRWGKKS
jgi:hypothetical protein